MRKILTSIIAFILCATTLWAERVSETDAALVANNFMNVTSSSAVHKSPAKRMVLKKAAAAEERQYYIYENENGEGWVMVAANDVAHPVLAYSETGRFSTENQPSNVRIWIAGYDRQIARAAQDGLTATQSIQEEWTALRNGTYAKRASAVVSPLIKSGWSQSSPYYNSCPTDGQGRCVTGCVATAMAQVMNYHKWPKQGSGSHSYTWEKCTSYTYSDGYYDCANSQNQTLTVDFSATTYDWNNMLDHYTELNSQGYEVLISGLTSAQKNAVATLMYHCGVAVDMTYSSQSSGAYTIDYNGYFSSRNVMCAEKALTQFFGYNSSTVKGYCRNGDPYTGMKSWTKPQWIAMLKEELNAARPIMYAGVGCDDPNDNETCYGHSFVCDGYDSNDYFHFNFGWTNWCDGYYEIDALDTEDPGTGGGNGSYSLEQDVIIGIQPPVVGHEVVVNGTGCTIVPSSLYVENNNALTATITPTDATYDFTSLTVKLGSTTLSSGTHYTLSDDKQSLSIKASAITGDNSNDLTITAVWTKNRYSYEFVNEYCTVPEDGMIEKNAPLNFTITPDEGYSLADASCWEVEMGGNALTYGTDFTYTESTGAFTITSVTGDVVILVSGGKSITWYAHGEPFATNMALGNKLTLPAGTPEGCDSKVFYGWTATGNYSSETIAPTIVKEGDDANAATYYAVFATENEGGGTPSIEKAGSIAVGDKVILVYETDKKELSGISSTSTPYGEGAAYSITPVGAYLLDVVAGNASGTYALKHGNEYLQWNSGNSLSTKSVLDAKSSWTITFSGGNATIKNASDNTRSLQWNSGSPRFACYTSSQKAVQLYKQTGGGGVSYSGYTTSCAPPSKYTVRFLNNGTVVSSEQYFAGQTAVAPSNPETDCTDYAFAGWWTAELDADNTEAKEWITDFTVTGAQDYHAIYSKTEEGAESNTLVEDQLTRAITGVSGTSYSNWENKSVNSDAVYAGNSAGGNSSIQLRTDNNNSGIITTSSGGTITKVAVVWESHTADGRTLDVYGKNTAYSEASDLYGSAAGTKLGSIKNGESTELEIDGSYTFIGVRSQNKAMYLSSITFTWYSGGSSNTTYYTSTVSCQATEIENNVLKTESQKILRNGQILILRDGKVFNLLGSQIR